MNQDTQIFVGKLALNPLVLWVILFGSWARGNNHPGSDVDLVVVLSEGYKRCIEQEQDQIFEIIYITADNAFDFWSSHRDAAAWLWEVAKILYDRDGSIAILAEKTKSMLAQGKKPMDIELLWQMRFGAEDHLRYAQSVMQSDPITANLLVSDVVSHLTEWYFDIRAIWIPAPKQRMGIIRSLDPELYSCFWKFYAHGELSKSKLDLVKSIAILVFDRQSLEP